MYKTLSAPHVVQIEVSSMCTNRCLHCYNFWRQGDGIVPAKNLSLEQVDRIMDQLVASKVFHLVLTGGEPLLNKTGLFRILKRATENNMTVGINSTLVGLTSNDAVELKEFGVTVVLTSLLGPTAEVHDKITQQKSAFEKTVQGIRLLKQMKVPVSVNMVVSQKNQSLIRETAIFVKSLGLKSFNATRAGCPGNCSDFSEFSLDLPGLRLFLEELYTVGVNEDILIDTLASNPLCGIKKVNRYQKLATRRCMAGINTVTISATGDVRPCGHLEMNYGNLLQENLPDIWQRMTEWRDGSMIPATCKSCKVLPWCGGGCRMEAKMKNGSLSGLDPYASPSDVDYVFTQLTSRDKKKFSSPTTVRVNPRMRWRSEEFGAAFFVGARFACYLNHEGLKLIQELPRNSDLSMSDLAEKLGKDQDKFVTGLIERGILV